MTEQTRDSILDLAELEEQLSEPSPGVIETMRRLEGDLILLGVGGKMGPTMARMAKRASETAGVERRVIGVSRFSAAGLEQQLQEHGIETIRCDLLDPKAVAALPDVQNVLYMVGMKFGTTGQEPLTWAMNVAVPALVAQRYAGANIVAMSTGNVCGMSSVSAGGAKEPDTLEPVGEYAMSALGRERIFEHYALAGDTPTALIRLYYAVEMRYGVPVDIAQRIWRGENIDLTMGYASIIWQGDANAHTLQAFGHVATPARAINVSGPAIVRIRDMAERLGQLMDRTPEFTGSETDTALVCNTSLSQRLFGKPRVALDTMYGWIADWVMRGGESLGKPTHFEDRDGKF